ncbi:MAG: SDR family oxidoreductase [Solirubrobacteraceae bacterium]|jgi:short-subunit dehydrogenase
MASLLTGATGFIGRHLVERLLARDGDVYIVVRSASVARARALFDSERVVIVAGDLELPMLGVEESFLTAARGTIERGFHLAALYDMRAGAAETQRASVLGTRNMLDLAAALELRCLNHVSSVAVAGRHRGTFTEADFDLSQTLPSPYHAAKFEAERLVRDQTAVPWRIYRPSIVVGHSQTGEMDKIDGPYYFFKAIARTRHLIPEWVPLVGPELGHTNIVPVDFVADAIDHIAHLPALDGRTFHLSSPRSQRSGEVINAFARAAHAPTLALRIDHRILAGLPAGSLSTAMALPAVRQAVSALLADLGIPSELAGNLTFDCRFDTTQAQAALAGSGIAVPPLEDYAARLWDFWERTLDPELDRAGTLAAAVAGRHVLITGASSGIGQAAAHALAAAGAIPILVARSAERLEQTRAEIEAAGGQAHVFTADLSDRESIESLVERVLAEHPVDVLVNNAGRSIRRSAMLAEHRFHDYERTMALNYFGAARLSMALMAHMRERGGGHIVNVSTIGVQVNPPRFSAYVASKAALDAFTRVVSSEVIGDGITFTTIHMPLVRTPMIAPTRLYRDFPAISPEEAAEMICEAIRSKPKEIGTRLGTVGEVAYALAPKLVDQLLHAAFKLFPDSPPAQDEEQPEHPASDRQLALASLLRGVHW